MQVSFWSNSHQLGTTHNMIAVAVFAALEYRMRILMANAHFNKNTLETAFIEKRYMAHELMNLSDTGIDALSRYIRFNRVKKDEITSYTTTILRNRLELLIGTGYSNTDIYFSNLKEAITRILQSAAKVYDLILIDTIPGKNEISSLILEHSDLIVVNLCQNINLINSFLSGFGDMKENIIILLGKYDENSRYNLKLLRKKFGTLQIHAIPYDIGFADACADSRVIDFFIKNLPVSREDIHYPFVQGVRDAVQVILSRAGSKTMEKKIIAGNGYE